MGSLPGEMGGCIGCEGYFAMYILFGLAMFRLQLVPFRPFRSPFPPIMTGIFHSLVSRHHIPPYYFFPTRLVPRTCSAGAGV